MNEFDFAIQSGNVVYIIDPHNVVVGTGRVMSSAWGKIIVYPNKDVQSRLQNDSYLILIMDAFKNTEYSVPEKAWEIAGMCFYQCTGHATTMNPEEPDERFQGWRAVDKTHFDFGIAPEAFSNCKGYGNKLDFDNE